MIEPKRLWIPLIVLFLRGWRSERCWEPERIALLQLKSFFNTPHSLHNWVDVKGSNCCEWERVECSIVSRRVIGLSLYSTRQPSPYRDFWYLNASLFLPFEELKSLDLSMNQIAGFLNNQELNSLTNLKILDLSDNNIESLRYFQGMINLESLDLLGNRLKNSSLAYLSGLSSLKSLNISYNQLEGLVDIKELNNLTNLKALVMSYNRIESLQSLHGSERELKLINLEELDLSGNLFNNSILALLSGFSSMKILRLGSNQLKGSINIKELGALNKLEELDISFNELKEFVAPKGSERELKLINLEKLDLTGNLFSNSILALLSGLSSLKILNLRQNRLKGSVNIKELGALNNLEKLDISYNELKEFLAPKGNRGLGKLKTVYLDDVFTNASSASPLRLVETFSSAKTLFLRGNYFNKTGSSSSQDLHVSSNVEELLLDDSYLNNDILQSIGALTSLRALSLSSCGLTSTLPTRGWCDLPNLGALDLSGNAFEGTLPTCLGNLSSLQYLDISDNQFTGNGALPSLSNLTLLRFVSLSKNLFEVPTFFVSFANHSHLKVLLSDQNKLVKEPATFQTWVPKFQLEVFHFSNCTTKELHKELPKLLYYQYDLRVLDLSYNNFGGQFPSWLLENKTRLEGFFMKGNSFLGPLQLPSHPNLNMSIVDISDNKIQCQIPPNICSTFPSLGALNLSSNALDGNIPPCLGDLNNFFALDLSHNQLSGGIPEELAKSDSLQFLRLSNNNLSGKIAPAIFTLYSLVMLYLDGNNFDGEIPSIDNSTVRLPRLWDMDLSNNNLSGKLPRWIWNLSTEVFGVQALAFSNNQLEGPIPTELCYLDSLEILDLSQNNFSGPIPSCFHVGSIKHLHLSRNRLSGTLTRAFSNSSSLVTLDLSENHFTGEIPSWVSTLSALSVLLLKANNFTGEIPVQLCDLHSLSIIDLSQNKLSGPVPSCLSNLTLKPNNEKSLTRTYFQGMGPAILEADHFGMAIFESFTFKVGMAIFLSLEAENHMEVQVDYTTKRGSLTYKGTILNYMSGIDLSCNRLTGQIPPELGNLNEILSLNLSHNNLTGLIPSTFSKLKQIESLDLSHNNLVGRIPVQLMKLNALEVFNVSYNNLSGSIPYQKAQFGTFDESSYMGNRFLCGPPLHNKSCIETDSPPIVPNASDSEEDNCLVDEYVFWVTFSVTYAIVLLGIAATLYINPYWRRSWFHFIEHCITTCHFFIVDNLLKFFTFRRWM